MATVSVKGLTLKVCMKLFKCMQTAAHK